MTKLKIEENQSEKLDKLEVIVLEIEEQTSSIDPSRPPTIYVKFKVNYDGTIVRFGGGIGDKFTAFDKVFEIKECQKPLVVFEIQDDE